MSTTPIPVAKSSELRAIKAGEFKATCLALLDEASLREHPLAITKHGKVVAHVVAPPAEEKPFRSIVGRSPGINVPSQKQWRKLKDQWAQEWEDSFERRAAILYEKPKKQKRA